MSQGNKTTEQQSDGEGSAPANVEHEAEASIKIEAVIHKRIPLNLQLDESWTTARCEQLDGQILAEIFKPVVLDCRSVSPDVSLVLVKAIFRLAKEIGKVEIPLILVNCSPEFIATVKNQGSHPAISFATTMSDVEHILEQHAKDELLSKSQGKPGRAVKKGAFQSSGQKAVDAKSDIGLSIDVKYVNPFLSSALQVFKAQANTDVKTGVPFRKEQNDKVDGEVSGMINLSSPIFQGTVVISFPVATLQNLMTKMLGPKDEYTKEEIKSGAGELLNIIFIKGKATLNQLGLGVESALPVVCEQPSSEILTTICGRVAVPFESDVGSFCIEVWGRAS